MLSIIFKALSNIILSYMTKTKEQLSSEGYAVRDATENLNATKTQSLTKKDYFNLFSLSWPPEACIKQKATLTTQTAFQNKIASEAL